MNRNTKKENRKASWSPLISPRIAHITGHWFISDVFWIIVIREDVDSDAACFYPRFDLPCYPNADKGPGQECLIGILQARLIFKLVLLQCLSWMGIFMRRHNSSISNGTKGAAVNVDFSPVFSPLCTQCALVVSSVFDCPSFSIQGLGGNNVLLND